MSPVPFRWPSMGCGVGLRPKHYSFILESKPKMDWFEAVTENYMDTGGRPLQVLEALRADYPVALHGVALSIGGTDPLDGEYLKKLKGLADRIQPFSISDHLCWTGVQGESLHDLLPLPFTEEAMKHVARRVDEVQSFLGRTILLENASAYITYKHSQVPEWEFLRELARRTGCGILLDLNNIYVNSMNHRFDAFRYIEALPPSMVAQFHLAGHTDKGSYLFDTHSAAVAPGVWKLYEKALRTYGQVSTLVEWDEDIPDFARLAQEAEEARRVYDRSRKQKPWEAPAVPLYFPPSPAVAGALPAGRQALAEVQKEFKQRVKAQENGAGLEPGGGIAVYAEGYLARLVEALGEVYESVRHLIGKDAFIELTELYLGRFPSRHYNLNDFGKELPGFIGETRFAQELPFLPDLAALEWAVSRSFHAYEEPPFDAAVLASYSEEDWEKMRVVFQPSVRALSSAWPVADLWQARKTPLGEMNVPLEGRPQNVLVFRRGTEVCCEVIDKKQFELLHSLGSGQPLGETCAQMAQGEEDLPLEQWFSQWTGQGLIAKVGS